MYYISKGSLKTANKQYSSLKNDYEMTINNDTIIEEVNQKDISRGILRYYTKSYVHVWLIRIWIYSHCRGIGNLPLEFFGLKFLPFHQLKSLAAKTT